MDNNSIAILQDYQSTIESSFKKMDKSSETFDISDQSQQNLIINNIQNELSSVKINLDLMRLEISNMKEEKNLSRWKKILNEFQSKYDSRKEELNKMKNKDRLLPDDSTNIDVKVDMSKMSSQQVMDRGDKILNADKDAITRMKKVVYCDLDTMKDLNVELLSQNEKLENADQDLKEIDYSLKRAGKQIKTMAKMYVTDKLILFMILCILLVIIAIIIVSFFFEGGEAENTKHDSFNNGENSNNSNYCYNKWDNFVLLLLLLLSYLV